MLRSHRPAMWLLTGALGVAGLLGGCTPTVPRSRLEAAQQEVRQLSDRNEELTRENEQLRRRLESQQQRIDTLMALGDKRLAQLHTVERIELGSHTGGVDDDDVPGDEAVRVYLKPIDHDGSVLKSAGDVKIHLYDLAADETGGNRLGECSYSPDEASEHWASGFFTYHYSFTCPLDELPAHDEITVRVEFVEYLTGRTFTAQTPVTIDPPSADRTPATQPSGGE